METITAGDPTQLRRDHLEMNYAVMAIALGRLMFEVNRLSMIVDPDDDPPDIDLRVRFEHGPGGKAYITMLPSSHADDDNANVVVVGTENFSIGTEEKDEEIIDGLMALTKMDHRTLVGQLGIALCTLSKLMTTTNTDEIVVDAKDYATYGLGLELSGDPVTQLMIARRRLDEQE